MTRTGTKTGTPLGYARTLGFAIIVAAVSWWSAGAQAHMSPLAKTTPKVGDKASNFTLQSLDGANVSLFDEVAAAPVVLVVLRGWPGYQCPFCTRQFGDYRAHASSFDKGGARVLFVYPGPPDGLKAHAETFTSGMIPASFRILLDPDYTFTEAYGLRWNAANETAYPSTFVLDTNGIVRFAQTSREHGGRVSASAVLEALAGLR